MSSKAQEVLWTLSRKDEDNLKSLFNSLDIVVAASKACGNSTFSKSWKKRSSLKMNIKSKPSDGNRSTSIRRCVCKNGHNLTYFKTYHGSFSCDICLQRQNTYNVMYGCRPCNWDACVNCHRLLREQEEAEEVRKKATAKPNEETQVQLDPSDIPALISCFDLYATRNIEIFKKLFEISKNLSSNTDFHSISFKDHITLFIEKSFGMDPTFSVAGIGIQALQNLLEISSLETTNEATVIFEKFVIPILTVSTTVASTDSLSATFGLLLKLIESSSKQLADGILFHSLTQEVLKLWFENLTSSSSNEHLASLTERVCALTIRSRTTFDKEYLLERFLIILKKYHESDDCCEEAYLGILTLSSKEELLINTQNGIRTRLSV